MSLCGTCAIQFKDDYNRMFCQYTIYNIYSHNGLQHRENITWICPVGAEDAKRREETSVAVHGLVSSCAGSGLANSGNMYNEKPARMAACGIVYDAYDGKEYGKSPDTSAVSDMCDNSGMLYVSSCFGFCISACIKKKYVKIVQKVAKMLHERFFLYSETYLK